MKDQKKSISDHFYDAVDKLSPDALVIVATILGGMVAVAGTGPFLKWLCSPAFQGYSICQ